MAGLEEARELWSAVGPTSYEWTFTHGGAFWGLEPIHVVVRNGTPMSFEQPGGPRSVEKAERMSYPLVVEDMFAAVDGYLLADEFEVQYDPTYGFPTSFSGELDTGQYTEDDSYGFTVRSFEPRE